MAVDKSKPAEPHRQRIESTNPEDVQQWAAKFGVTDDELKTAIMQVGNQVSDVERYLKQANR